MNLTRIFPCELAAYVIEQEYDSYTDEDRSVWRKVITEKEKFLAAHGHRVDDTYLIGFSKIGFSSERIPSMNEINNALNAVGWEARCVDGYLPPSIYASFIEHKIFPVARHIRRMEHIEHSPVPDFIHDVTGHLPMLFSQNYQEFLQQIISIMSKMQGNSLDDALFNANVELGSLKCALNPCIDSIQQIQKKIDSIQDALKVNPSVLTQLNRMFLWSIEFGLIGSIEEYKCYGAGMLTSPSELYAACHGTPQVQPFTMDVINYEIHFTDVQDQYFVVKSYEHLSHILNQYLQTVIKVAV